MERRKDARLDGLQDMTRRFMLLKLDELSKTAQAKATWKQQIFRLVSLGDQATDEDRLAAFRAWRDSGTVDPDSGFYMVAKTLGRMFDKTDPLADPKLAAISEKIDAAEKAHGLTEDEYFPLGEAPPDVQALIDEWDARFDQLKAAFFRQHGEDRTADLLLTDPKAFLRRSVRGCELLFGRLPDDIKASLRALGIAD